MNIEKENILLSQIREAIAASDQLPAAYKPYVLPAAVSARVSAGFLGGVLHRLFGNSPTDLPFIYQPTDYPISVPASTAPISSDVIVSQDSDFYAQRMSMISGNDGSGTFDFRVQLQWGANDRRWVNSQPGVHSLGVQGTGQRPYIFPNPIYIPASSRLSVILTSITSQARSVFVDFHGRKASDVSSLDLSTRRA